MVLYPDSVFMIPSRLFAWLCSSPFSDCMQISLQVQRSALIVAVKTLLPSHTHIKVVCNSQVTKKSFQRFLVDSPFGQVPCSAYPAGQCPPCGMGTFHQQYWLDGKPLVFIKVSTAAQLSHLLSFSVSAAAQCSLSVESGALRCLPYGPLPAV